MADPKPLSRDQLAKFLPDAEAIKRFERLFAVAGDLTPADVATLYRLAQEASISSSTAQASAQSALDQLGQIVQDAAINAGAADGKATQALDLLERIAQSLELLSVAPPNQPVNAVGDLSPADRWPSVSELADASVKLPVAGGVLIYDATLGVWKSTTLTAGTNVTITNADGSITVNSASSAVEIHAAPSKTTPVDADEIPLADSASAFTLKKLTWANLKATLATWIGGNFIAGSFTSLVSSTTGKVATTLGVGNAIPSASGSGVTFPATQSASSDANTLDDYEEGNWTPAVAVASGSITANATLTLGKYTKVGRLVTLTGLIYIDSVSAPSGSFSVTSCPFVTGTGYGFRSSGSAYGSDLKSTATTALGCFMVDASGTLYFKKFAAGAQSDIGADIQANTSIVFSITYMTN
jgi:hypothetical protein